MNAPSPSSPSWRDLLPMLVLALLVAALPPVGSIVVVMGLLGLWSRRAPGRWPWQAGFWEAMQWPVAGALGLITVGVVLHVLLVRPAWDVLKGSLG